MYFRLFYERTRNLIVDPVHEWEKIKLENARSEHISFYLAFPIFIAITFSYLLGKLWPSERNYFNQYDTIFIITDLLLQFAIPLLVLYTLYSVVKYINQGFQISTTDRNRDFRYLFYSLIPVYLYFIFSDLVPRFENIFILIGIFSIYLLYTGAKIMMEISIEKVIPYIVSLIIVYMLIYKIISEICRNLLHFIGNQISPLT